MVKIHGGVVKIPGGVVKIPGMCGYCPRCNSRKSWHLCHRPIRLGDDTASTDLIGPCDVAG